VPSREHDALVAGLLEAGMRTPEVFPDAESLAAARRAEETTESPLVDGVSITEVDAGNVPALRVVPTGPQPARTVVYLHGGGYIWMTPRTHLAVMAAIARESEARCLGLDYRRAPEHPFPAAVDDTVAAYQWLVDDGVDPRSIVFAGDSAGGGLVLATLVALRDAGVTLPAAAACISPWTDLAVTGASADTIDDPVVSGQALRMMAAVYLHGADAKEPGASPLYADPTGLPPLLIQVGTRESLLDDSRRFVDRARAAGVDVTFVEHPDVVHMWVVFGPELPESRRAFALIGDFVQRYA
jgi:acetyl esterase/lipase